MNRKGPLRVYNGENFKNVAMRGVRGFDTEIEGPVDICYREWCDKVSITISFNFGL